MPAAQRVPVPRGEPAPFDRDTALRAWREGVVRPAWALERFAIPRAMERAEALFWFYALTSSREGELRALDADRPVSLGDVRERVGRTARSGYEQRATADVMRALAHLFDAAALIALIEDESNELAVIPEHMRLDVQFALACGFCDHVAPFLPNPEFATCAAYVRESLARSDAGAAPFHLHHLAAALGVSDALPAYFAAVPRGRREQRLALDRQHLVYALGSRAAVVAEMKRLELQLEGAQAVREWLALTGCDGIAYAFKPQVSSDPDTGALIVALGTVHVVETAGAMLGLATRQGYADHAKAWLDGHPELAVPAAAAAAGKGTRRDAAVETLKRAAARGHAALVAEHASETLRAIVLGSREDDDEMRWLGDAAPSRRKPIRWLYADALPPLVVDGRTLDEREVDAAIGALAASTLVAPDPRALALKRHADAASAERFLG